MLPPRFLRGGRFPKICRREGKRVKNVYDSENGTDADRRDTKPMCPPDVRTQARGHPRSRQERGAVMDKTRGFKFREVLKNMGARSIVVSLLVFLLTVTLTCVVGYKFYDTTKENIHLQGKVNAVHAAKEFNGYLLVRKNTVILAGHVVDEMMGEGRTNAEILDYLTNESLSIKKSIDKDYTGLYGWINGEYLDGDGWVPEEDYVPTERPWYRETLADDSEITFVRPYLDAQTKTVLTTVAVKLADGKSVIALDITLSRVQEIAASIPIIALSANAFEEDVQQCLQAGMNEHLSKPVDVDRLKETLGRLLGLE